MKSLTLVLVGMLFAGIARAQYNQVNDIPYREAADGYAKERCKLDVYYPTNAQDAPVVVWFHGGGIEGGNKHIDPQLKNSGLVVVAANYRLLPKAPIDVILDDAAAAVAFSASAENSAHEGPYMAVPPSVVTNTLRRLMSPTSVSTPTPSATKTYAN